MIKTKEMFDATHRRNTQNDWSIETQLESSIESWMLGNYEDAKENLGEDVVAAISEVLDHE